MPIPLKTLLRLPSKFVAFLSDAKGAGMISAGAAAAAAGTGAAAAAPLAIPLALAAGGFFILDVCLDAQAEKKSGEESDELRRKLDAIFVDTDELVRRSPFTPAAAQRIAECESGKRELKHLIAPPGDPGAAVIELYKALKRQPPGGTDVALLQDIQSSLDKLERELDGGLPALASLIEASAQEQLSTLEAAGEAILSTVGENFTALGDYLATHDDALHAKLDDYFAEFGLQLTRIEEKTDRNYEATLETHAVVQRIERKLGDARQPSPPLRSLHGLPGRLGDRFTGRDLVDLTDLHFTKASLPGSPPLVLHGAMGVGKTTLAAELLYTLYDSGVIDHAILLPAGDPAAVPTLVENLALVLGLVPANQGPVPPEQARRTLAAWFSAPENAGRVVLFFDNADTPKSRDAVGKEAAAFPMLRVLTTSRRSDWPRATLHEVKEWTLPQALNFLGKRLPKASEQDRELLCKELGRLPLALELAVAVMLRLRLDATGLLGRWQTKLKDEKLTDREGNPTVAALLAISLESLQDRQRELFYILAQYAPQALPEKLVGSMGVEGWREELAMLADASLLEWSGDELALHPFIRQAALQEMGEDEAENYWLISLAQLSGFLPDSTWSERWGEWAQLHPHIAALWHRMPSAVPPRDSQWGRDLAQVLGVAGLHFKVAGAYDVAESLQREARRLAEATFGKDHPEVSIVLNNLAVLLQETHQLAEAEDLMREGLRINQTAFGLDHPTVAIRLNNLAQLFQATNRLAEAEPLMREVLRIDQAAFGPDHPEVATDLNNLAALLRATNRLAEAEPLMREALRIDRAAFDKGHPNIAIRLSNLAQLLKATSRLSEAEPLIREALHIDQTAFGKDHPRVAIQLSNLALVLQDTDQLVEAEHLTREALRIDRATFGADHPKVAIRLNNLAQILNATSRLAEAEHLMREALRIDQAAFGTDYPEIARDLNNLASLLQATNRLAEAEPLMREALRIDQTALGKDHPEVAIDLNNLASLLNATGRSSEAAPLCRRQLWIFSEFKRRTGHPHPHFKAALENYACLLIDLDIPDSEALDRVRIAIEEEPPDWGEA